MDDYFFLDKMFDFEDFQVIVNKESPLVQHFDLLIRIIEESPLLKEFMSGHTIPIAKYFRLRSFRRDM